VLSIVALDTQRRSSPLSELLSRSPGGWCRRHLQLPPVHNGQHEPTRALIEHLCRYGRVGSQPDTLDGNAGLLDAGPPKLRRRAAGLEATPVHYPRCSHCSRRRGRLLLQQRRDERIGGSGDRGRDLTAEERATVCAVMGGAGSVQEEHEVALITPTRQHPGAVRPIPEVAHMCRYGRVSGRRPCS